MESSAPKWVKNFVEWQQRRIAELEGRQIEILGEHPRSHVFHDSRGTADGEGRLYLPDRDEVTFHLDPKRAPDRHHTAIGCRIESCGTILHVSGSSTLEMVPWSSNLLRIRVADRLHAGWF